MPLDSFTDPTRHWFLGAFSGPTRIQELGWNEIRAGRHALLVAPTGSGKTLAAFLWGLDAVLRLPADAEPGTRVVYVSPLKALAYDVERNLRAPLVGIRQTAERLGLPCRDVRVDVRTGDTPQAERRRQLKEPAEILVTTPESLFLMLGSKARDNLKHVHTVLIDEVHALAPTKRGVHLALSLERLAAQTVVDPQRIGLSATVRPADEVARYLAGDRPVEVVDAAEPPKVLLRVTAPPAGAPSSAAEARAKPDPEDEGRSLLGELYTAPAIGGHTEGHGQSKANAMRQGGGSSQLSDQVLEMIRAHRSTIVFTNSRGQCERLAQRLNDAAGEELVLAHHGSVSQNKRREIEEALKRGEVRGIVATSSLELGVDMGAVDLAVLIDSPGSVARGLQRVGRAGHQVDATSAGVLMPKFRGDLLECAVVASRMRVGELEAVRVPRRCLDVLAQQIVAMVVDSARDVDEVERIVKRAHPYRDLARPLLVAVLDMLSGRYPSDDMADLQPRLSWDRTQNRLQARRGTPMISRLNAGTIPDRGLFHVHLGDGGPRIGELDEEMVYETRSGDVILLGSSSWRVLEITRDRVLVEPAPGEPGRLPFWRGEGLGRPVELGRAVGAMLRRLESLEQDEVVAELQRCAPLDDAAARQLADYVNEQKEHAGVVPTDQRVVVERFRDELGDWRICILSPFGGRIHAPWAMALQSLLSARRGFEVVSTYNDDGIVLTFAEAEDPPDHDELFPAPEELEELVADQLDGSALFGSAFRENAARALLTPRRNPKARSPLWAQRLKAKNLMAAVLQFSDFPIVLETYRHCMRDVFDLPGLSELLRGVRDRSVRVEPVETRSASPFARSLVFAHVASYLYEQDAPLAERRSHALTLDRSLLGELLGETELRQLLAPEVIEQVEAELQSLLPERQARDADELHDLLRRLGALGSEALSMRCSAAPRAWLEVLVTERRAITLTIDGQQRWAAAQDAGLYRDALGTVPPQGLPEEFVRPVANALQQLVRRCARQRGPFTTDELAAQLGLAPSTLAPVLDELERAGVLVAGEMSRSLPEWCDADVLRRIKRQTLARMRREVAPVDPGTLAQFLVAWQGVGQDGGDPLKRLLEVASRLEGLALPWTEWVTSVLPSRVPGMRLDMLDMLSATGQLVWIGRGALGNGDGKIAIYRRETVALLHDAVPVPEQLDPVPAAILESLEQRGADFTESLRAAVKNAQGGPVDSATFETALWDLVWAGLVTNDTFAPLRQLGASKRGRGRRAIAGGRWSLVRTLVDADLPATARAHARASMLLERYGVVSRAAASAEELAGGFSSSYGVLKAMEESGRARRGLFVDGLDGAQFALPGAVDRLRAVRDQQDEAVVHVLAAVDPANPWGALLSWPETTSAAGRPRRTAGARVALVDGVPACYLTANGRGLLTFPAAGDDEVLRAGLRALVEAPHRRALVLERVDGLAPGESPRRDMLEQCGFGSSYRGWSLREAARA